MVRESRRSVRQAAGRKRSVYTEPDTDDEFDDGYEGMPTAPARGGSSSKRRRRAANGGSSIYAEPNTDDEFEVAVKTRQASPIIEIPRAKKPKSRKVQRRHTRSRAKGKQSIMALGRRRRVNSKANPEKKDKVFTGPSDHKSPEWTSLPVSILKDIFIFSITRDDNNMRSPQASADASWLLKAATTCRAFAQPALEAFYTSPILFNTLQPHELLELLRRPPESRILNYNVKVKSLYIEAEILAHVAPNRLHFNLASLIAELPQLQDLQILSESHFQPFRLHRPIRWSYPLSSLLNTLNEKNLFLKSWRWSRDLINKEESNDLYGTMTIVHSSRALERLERLIICGFNVDGSSELVSQGPHAEEESNDRAPALAATIAQLPMVNDLTFVSCDIIYDRFLIFLPKTIQRIELTNCLEITSDLLRDYFKVSGPHLREVVLRHNPALNLSFLTSLDTTCPNLEVLLMDFTYYSERLVTKDADPLYDELLPVTDVPTWPPTLRRLELSHAQKCSADGAQNLFRSLIENAPGLQDLRKLVIYAHINTASWRERLVIRDQWIKRLRKVFLRPQTDPLPHLGSLRQYRLWKLAEEVPKSERAHAEHSELEHVARRLTLSPQVQILRTGTVQASSNGMETRRSRRVADNQAAQASKYESSTSETDSDSAEEEDEDPEKYIQGLCDVVDVSIDNQRPRETHFTERDFLDSEKSGDEDWDENADDADLDGYAW